MINVTKVELLLISGKNQLSFYLSKVTVPFCLLQRPSLLCFNFGSLFFFLVCVGNLEGSVFKT